MIIPFLFSLNAIGQVAIDKQTSFPDTVKHSGYLMPPHGFKAFFDLDEGLAYAKKTGKPLLIDFTGHASIDSRKMEYLIWSAQSVKRLISEEFVLIQLYLDEYNVKIPAEKVHYSLSLERETTNLGLWVKDFQITKYRSSLCPMYVLADHNLEPLVEIKGVDFNSESYYEYLESGLKAFKKIKQSDFKQ